MQLQVPDTTIDCIRDDGGVGGGRGGVLHTTVELHNDKGDPQRGGGGDGYDGSLHIVLSR